MAWLDSPTEGREHAQRMDTIMRVICDHGIAQHDVTLRHSCGVEVRAVADVQSGNRVQHGPRADRYAIEVINSAKLRTLLSLAEPLAQALNVDAVSVRREGQEVWVTVPRREWDPIAFAQVLGGRGLPVGQIVLGVDERGQRVVLDVTKPENAHMGIIGTTGSGKSTLLRTMAASALLGGMGAALLDLSGGLLPLGGHPGVWRGGCHTAPGSIAQALSALVRRLDRHDNPPPLLVCIDEVPALAQAEPRTKGLIQALAQRGRAAGLHLALGAQHALVEELGSVTMRNLPVRLIGRCVDATAAYNAAGIAFSLGTQLAGRGDFALVRGADVLRFQAPLMDDSTLDAWQHKWPTRVPREWPDVLLLPDAPAASGRPMDDIPAEMIDRLRAYQRDHGRMPSQREVQRWTQAQYGVIWNVRKVARAMEAAQ
jgi:hypothetical protein